METKEETIDRAHIQAPIIQNTLTLIRAYRLMEKAPLENGYATIRQVAPSHLHAHLCGHWRGKKKQFGSFFLNLDYKIWHAILKKFGIHDEQDAAYVIKIEDDPRAMLFEKPPGFMAVARKMLVFFENHGIDPDPVGDGTLILTHLPVGAKKRYGNSANWGDYILSLTMVEQIRVLRAIIFEQTN